MSKKCGRPVDAVVAVTYRCNSRCIMCNIWQIKDFPELPPKAYLKLPASLRDVNVSGGEPFLRTDLSEIVKNIKIACPKAQINISSNGFLTEVIKRQMPQLLEIDPELAISISLDGVGAMHEQVRRIPDGFAKDLATIRFCRDALKMSGSKIKIAFTLNNENYEHLTRAAALAQELGVSFTMAIAHSSTTYFNASNELKIPPAALEREFGMVIRDLLKSRHPKDWARAYFVDGLYRLARGESSPLRSFSGEDYFFLDPRGDVYPSVLDDVIMGNINDCADFEQLWCSEQARQARAAIQAMENDYWMICTARTAIKRNPLKVANWIFKNKLNLLKWVSQ